MLFGAKQSPLHKSESTEVGRLVESNGLGVRNGTSRVSPQETGLRYLVIAASLAAMFGVIGLALAVWMLSATGTAENPYPYRAEAFKALLQFLLVTGAGGIILAMLGWLRDQESEKARRDRAQELSRVQALKEEEELKAAALRENELRRAARVEALQEMDRDLRRAYRGLKAVKRQLRTCLLTSSRDDSGEAKAPFLFEQRKFMHCMEGLLVAQIQTEDIRDHISVRLDLFDQPTLEKMYLELNYAARFFHDVHEDYERGLVKNSDDRCAVEEDSCNIAAMISSGCIPGGTPAAVELAIASYMAFRKDRIGLEQWHDRIQELDKLRLETNRRRYRVIADDCFALVSARIRAAVAKESNGGAEESRVMVQGSYEELVPANLRMKD